MHGSLASRHTLSLRRHTRICKSNLRCCFPTPMTPGTRCQSAGAHTPTRAALLCLCGVVRIYTKTACAAADQRQHNPVHVYTPARAASLCLCGVSRIYTGIACRTAPKRQHTHYALLVSRCAYTHTSRFHVSVASCAYTREQLVLLLLNGITARYMYIQPHEQLCSASAASCAYMQGQRVSLISDNTTHDSLLVGRCTYTCTTRVYTQKHAPTRAAFLPPRRYAYIRRSSLCCCSFFDDEAWCAYIHKSSCLSLCGTIRTYTGAARAAAPPLR